MEIFGKSLELTIGSNYVNDWSISDAVREILQNSIDQQKTDPDNIMSIKTTGDILEIRNKTSKLTKSSLILGSSTKSDDDDTIGKFGEGYKLALIVLLRNGVDVVIHNNHEKECWIPTIKYSKTYKTDLLTIDIEKSWFSKPDNDLVFSLQGIKNPEAIVKEVTLQRDEYEILETEFGDILIGEPGNIYVDGLFVSKVDYLKHSYSIKPKHLNIGRDRNLIDGFDLKYVTSKMWMEKYQTMKGQIIEDLENGVEDVVYCKFEHSRDTRPLLKRDLLEKVGNRIPVSNEEEKQDMMKKFGPDVPLYITTPTIVSITKDKSMKKFQPVKVITLNERLESFYKKHKKQFTREMKKDFQIFLNREDN